MKLANRYNRINITTTILIFIAGSVTFYFVLKYFLLKQLDETLQTEQQEIIQYVKEHKRLPEILPAHGQKIVYNDIASPIKLVKFRTIKQLNEKGKDELQRELIFGIEVSGKPYRITVSKSQVETEEVLQLVIIVTLNMIALILLTAYLINRIILNRLWQPFYQSVALLKKYSLSDHVKLDLPETDIDEFSLLNQSISNMTDRVLHDYNILKEFSGNAAHEMQTPLAVIRSKLDILMQNEGLLQHSSLPLLDIENSVNKLSRLNQSLLLLTKIENKRFELNKEVQLDTILQEKLAELAEIIVLNRLTFKTEIEELSIYFHPQLAEILFNNLLNNAIRYNYSGGLVDVTLNAGSLIISNTSELPELDKEKIFQRFYRHQSTRVDGNGLGLSIVKQICEAGNFLCEYQYISERHVFRILFS